MTREANAMLRTARGIEIPLKGVTLAGLVDGCLFELTVEQRYVNREAEAIEAVYTFPLPLNAVLLSFELQIGERRLSGVVSRKAAATRLYESAIESGDTAALLERAADGLYTVSLGNLKAGEEALIRYRYAELLEFDAGRVRIAIPTAVAPRYGNPALALEAHQVPAVDLTANYPLGFTLIVRGELARSRIESPTHALIEVGTGTETTLTTRSGGALDRDLIVLIQGIESSSLAVTEPDGEGYVVLASLAIPAATTEVRRPKALKVVVDCSGSMAGDSIHQARDAILGTLATLTAEDHVSLTRFGNNYEHLTQGMRPFVPATALELNDKVRALDATLGGTELERALDAVLQLPPPTGQGADVLLITDGEIWELDPVVQRAAASRHRLFVIAVGSSPAEALARRIASVTKGACEFVTPGEDMAAAVRRLIAKIAAPSETLGSIRWPAEPMWTVGLGQSVFPGMTCHVFAGFAARPAGSVEIATESGSAAGLRIDLPSESSSGTTLARVAAMQRLADLGEEEAAGLAERYQLVTSYTSCAVVLERAADDKAGDAPNLRAVPQMLAAGWAATSAVSRQRFLVTGPSPPMMDYCLSVDDMGIGAPPNPRSAALPESKHRKPSVSRSPASRPPSFSAAEPTDGAWVQTLATALNDGWRTSSLNDLEDIGVPKELLEMLQAITNEEASDEPEIVVAWIAVIASGPESHRFSSSVKEELERVANPRLRARIIAAMGVIWAPNLLKPLAPKLPERP